MGYEAAAQGQILRLLKLFEPHVKDVRLHAETSSIVGDHTRWGEAHDQFKKVRNQLLRAERKGKDGGALLHLSFLEAALKTVFNETDTNAPFDSISPFFVVPLALELAPELGLPLADVRHACGNH